MSAIAVLAWGSLVWDPRPEFDRRHDPWEADGPVLKLEFSRISAGRNGALTLVIDPVCGVSNQVSFAISRRTVLADAVADLQQREGTVASRIGVLCRASGRLQSHDPEAGEAVAQWAAAKGIDAVVWTDLPGNFEEKTGRAFSIDAAITYLQGLDAPARGKAVAYIANAPGFIQTPLRRALIAETWFAAEAQALGLPGPAPG